MGMITIVLITVKILCLVLGGFLFIAGIKLLVDFIESVKFQGICLSDMVWLFAGLIFFIMAIPLLILVFIPV